MAERRAAAGDERDDVLAMLLAARHTDGTPMSDEEIRDFIAHGMLLLSYTIGLVPNAYIIALRRIKNVVYKAPVVFGDTVHVRGKIERLKPFSDDVGLVGARWKLANQEGETCVKMEFEMLWRNAWIT